MKRILCIFALLFATLCMLTACGDTSINVTVNDDGYIVINGEQTEYQVKAEDVISVDGGYLVVNGIKTEHKVKTEDVITFDGGYLVVNGIKTEHIIKTEDVISVDDGYLVVNGIKTEYEVKNSNHNFDSWKLYNEDETDCEKKLYFRTCPDCSTVEWKQGKYEDHQFDEKYISDGAYHWNKCKNCEVITEKIEHTIGDDSSCTACGEPLGVTEGIMYAISDDGTYAMVVGYNGTAKIVKIADEYNGLPVKIIYHYSFEGNRNISKVIIPDSVTTIGSEAFRYCNSLTSVTIPDSVTSIGSYAFSGCDSLTSVIIPDSVTSIGNSAFYGCSELENVTMSNFSIIMDYGVFYGCNKIITEYNYGKYVCVNDNPYAIMIDVTNTYLNTYEIHKDTKIIASDTFEGFSRLIAIVIPDSVITIGNSAFYHCYSLKSVTIGNSVTSIGDEAFYYCSSLTSVTIGNSVTSIGDEAFYYCDSLKSVIIPDSVTSIGDGAFSGCDNLTSVTIGNSVTSIGNSAFFRCESLTSVIIPDSVTSIGDGAFYDCYSLSSVTIGNSVTSVGDYAFSYCSDLTDVYYEGSAEDWAKINIESSNYYLKKRHHTLQPQAVSVE